MSETTAVVVTRVPLRRLQRAEKILQKLGLTPANAVNILMAQTEIHPGLPFGVTPRATPFLTPRSKLPSARRRSMPAERSAWRGPAGGVEHIEKSRPVLACRARNRSYRNVMSITLEVDEQALRSLPLRPEERERDMKIELACRYYAKGWLSFGQAARMAGIDHYTLAAEMAERGIPRNLSLEDVEVDLTNMRRQPQSFYQGLKNMVGSVDGVREDSADVGGMVPAPFDLPLPSRAVPVVARTIAELFPAPFELRESDLAPE